MTNSKIETTKSNFILYSAQVGKSQIRFTTHLESSQLCLGLAPHGEGAMSRHVLDVHTIQLQSAVFPHLIVVIPVPLGEAPLLADEDLLTSGKLELGTPESLNTLSLTINSDDFH